MAAAKKKRKPNAAFMKPVQPDDKPQPAVAGSETESDTTISTTSLPGGETEAESSPTTSSPSP